MQVLQANRGWRLTLALLALIGIMSFIGGAAFAQQGKIVPDDKHPSRGSEIALKTQEDSPGISAIQPLATSMNGGTIVGVNTVREGNASVTSSTTFVDIPGATTTMTVPSGQARLFIATFSAESACAGASGWCSVRLMITGPSGTFEMLPASGSDFAFDSSDNGTETGSSWQGLTVQRSFSVGASGTWTITAQQMVTAGAITFRLDDWVLRVDQATF